ncbi:MAG: FapA family protein [Phycisphaeraceae bacterium]
MTDVDTNHEALTVRAAITSNRRTAELRIPGTFPRDDLTPAFCRLILSEAGVEITAQIDAAIGRLAEDPPPAGEDVTLTIATAVEAVSGEDGALKWLVDEAESETNEPGPDESVCFYQWSAYVMVEPGQVLAQVTDPTDGVDGRDVTGRTIAARAGRNAPLTHDDSIMRDARGRLIAQIAGVLIRQRDKATIAPRLDIQGNVDFSTGNIDFDGEVHIAGSVCDRFVVNATAGVRVNKLIEAATITCGGDLLANSGIAARNQGRLQIGGSLFTRYLDSVVGSITGDLNIDRECIRADLHVGGNITGPRASIVGGSIVVARGIQVATIGSLAHIPTFLQLASMPRKEQVRDRARILRKQIEEHRSKLLHEQMELDLHNELSAAQRERLMEIEYELAQAPGQIEKCVECEARINQQLATLIQVDVTIHRKLFGGVTFSCGSENVRVRNDLPGPLRITRSTAGELVGHVGSRCAPLAELVSGLQKA